MQVDSITYTNLTGRPDERTVYTVAASVAYPRTLIFAVNRRRLVVIGMAATAEHDVGSAAGVKWTDGQAMSPNRSSRPPAAIRSTPAHRTRHPSIPQGVQSPGVSVGGG